MNGYNFTDATRSTLQRARGEAAALGHDYVDTAHVLIALIGDSDVGTTLRQHALSGERIATVLFGAARSAAPSSAAELPYTSRAKKALEGAMIAARTWGNNWVGSEHLLVGVFEADHKLAEMVRDQGVDPAALIDAMQALVDTAEGNSVEDRVVRSASMPSRRDDRVPRSRPVYRAVAIDRTTRAIAIAALCIALLALVLVLLRP